MGPGDHEQVVLVLGPDVADVKGLGAVEHLKKRRRGRRSPNPTQKRPTSVSYQEYFYCAEEVDESQYQLGQHRPGHGQLCHFAFVEILFLTSRPKSLLLKDNRMLTSPKQRLCRQLLVSFTQRKQPSQYL